MRYMKFFWVAFALGIIILFSDTSVCAKTYKEEKVVTLTGTIKKHRQTAANGTRYTGYHLVLDKKIKVRFEKYDGGSYTEQIKKLTVWSSEMPKGFKISQYSGKRVKVKGKIRASLSGWYCCDNAIFIKNIKKVKSKKKK